ncbi:RNA polymerase sigma-70 factor (sigma-E family) [Kribbella amoyensis]|uniref:RNA polymerase sigma-70 factor (Sigma-E family) n=1 Tax=Kribbella amoyensis TaxID=996641 RepID=A0A561BUD3_9ACTN|nr:SigE family RNA polymerase sigma factor [Kribbella amoyensis]TWD82540.1 RNA polymerase sigma-70 factor (sigma-E family) [Kribbella amoyensis]
MTDGAARDEDFTAFVAAKSGRLVRFAYVLCGDQRLAEDLVQTALEKAYLRWHRIELGDPFGYVRQAVVNHHLSWLRRRSWRERPVGGPAELDLDSPAPPVEDVGLGVQRRTDVEAALGALTKRERAVVVLRYVEDLSEAETAAVLGIAVGTVKSTAARALGKLRLAPELAHSMAGGEA